MSLEKKQRGHVPPNPGLWTWRCEECDRPLPISYKLRFCPDCRKKRVKDIIQDIRKLRRRKR